MNEVRYTTTWMSFKNIILNNKNRYACHIKQGGAGGVRGLLWWISGNELTFQCRRPGFDPWVGTIPWRRTWQPTPILLPGEFHGERSLVGYSSQGCTELDMTEVTKQQQHDC